MQLMAGASIGNRNSGSEEGTIACFGKLRSTGQAVLLSANHVIFADGATPTIAIGSPNAGSCRSCCPKNLVADASLAGAFGTVGATYLDCAIAVLRAGVTGINQVSGLKGKARDGSDAAGFLKGTHAAVDNERVTVATKRGLITGSVFSSSSDVHTSPTDVQKAQIVVQTDPQFAEDVVSGTGDSGSAVINQFNEVIGLMHSRAVKGGSISIATDLIVASPIQAVMDKLGIDIPSASPTPHSSGSLREEVPAIGPEPELLRLQQLVLKSGAGALLHEAGQRHGPEVISLVHHCRPVTVAWHRSQGPAWAAHLINSARDPAYRVPDHVDGITQDMLLRRMAAELIKHGSEALRRDIDQQGPMVIGLAGIASVADLLERVGAPLG